MEPDDTADNSMAHVAIKHGLLIGISATILSMLMSFISSSLFVSYKNPEIGSKANGLSQHSMVRFIIIVCSQWCLVNREMFHAMAISQNFSQYFWKTFCWCHQEVIPGKKVF